MGEHREECKSKVSHDQELGRGMQGQLGSMDQECVLQDDPLKKKKEFSKTYCMKIKVIQFYTIGCRSRVQHSRARKFLWFV